MVTLQFSERIQVFNRLVTIIYKNNNKQIKYQRVFIIYRLFAVYKLCRVYKILFFIQHFSLQMTFLSHYYKVSCNIFPVRTNNKPYTTVYKTRFSNLHRLYKNKNKVFKKNIKTRYVKEVCLSNSITEVSKKKIID